MSGPPPGFDPSISRLPDPGPSAAPMVAMSGGGNSDILTTITILGESYRIRKVITAYPLLEEENRVLEAFLVDPNNHKIPDKTVFEFFYALATYNCEKEEGVLLNPKCEPVRAILRSTLLTAIRKQEPITPRPIITIPSVKWPLVKSESCSSFLLLDGLIKRRNKLNVDIYLCETDPTNPIPAEISECLLLLDGLLKRRNKLNVDINLCETDSTNPIPGELNECLLLLDGLLKRRNKLNVDINLCETDLTNPIPSGINDCVLLSDIPLKNRNKINSDIKIC
jgi:hypothetical protein